MIFLETTVFTRRVLSILPDDEYRQLQAMLVDHPGWRNHPWQRRDTQNPLESIGTRQTRWRKNYLLLGNIPRTDFDVVYLRQK